MAEQTSGESSDTPRGDGFEPRQRRRRSLEPADGAATPSPEAAPAPERRAEQAFPPSGIVPAGVQRRRAFGDQADGKPASSTPAASEPTAPAPREPEPAPSPKPAGPEPVPAAPPPPPSTPAGKKPAAAAGENVSGVRRAIRIVLLLVLMAATGGVFYILIEDLEREGAYGARDSIPEFTPLPPNPEGERLADTLDAQLKAGRYDLILDKRAEYMAFAPRHAQVLRDVYLAEAVKSVRDASARLAEMPETDTEDGTFLSVEERLRRLVPRMAILNRMTEFRNDWGETLLDVPGIRDIFDMTAEETFLANRRVSEWRRYQATFEDAYNDINAVLPNYEAIIAKLQPLELVLPNNGVTRICRNLKSLLDARNSVSANDMRSANDALSLVELRTFEPPPRGVEDRLEIVIGTHRDQIAGQFASWRKLWEESEKAMALYAEGDMPAAIDEIRTVVASTTPDSTASQSLYDELVARGARWASINDAHIEAVRQDAAGHIPDRMRAWQHYASLLDPETDRWQVQEAVNGAQRIKNEFNADLEDFHDRYADEWGAYEEITSKQRQPSSPREEFAEAAAGLRRLALAAEETLRIRSMAQTIELTDKSKMALSVARQILAEQGGQAQSLWNLGRLYRDRGEISRFRECLERIILLGENPSNPFHTEAKTLLSEENAGD